MQARKHSKSVILLAVFLALLTVLMTILSVMKPISVYAVKNTKITQMIMVQPFGGDHMQQMQNAVQSQFSGDGSNDAMQHQWVYSLNSVMNYISSDQDTRDKQAIVIWANSSRWLDSKDTATFLPYFNRSNKGSDSDAAIGDAATYNATGFARMLYGYDYQYEFTFNVWESNDGSGEIYGEDYSDNPYAIIDECRDGSENDVTGLEPAYNHGYHCQDEHVDEYDEETDTWTCSDPEHHGHSAHEHCVQKTETVTRTFHVKGVIETWREQYGNLKIYVFEDGPRSKEYFNNENLSNGQAEMMESLNDAPKKFNTALQSGCSDCISMFETLYLSNPYFADRSALQGASPNYYYNDETYRFIFHMMWNTILNLNPNDDIPENVDESLYSVSSSLTAYMNSVLSASAYEAEDGNTHVLMAANTDYVGNAGAFLGYGDKDFGFTSFITGNHSKTSSIIDYSSLIGIEGANASSSTNEMYLYARYGYLLSDLGLDDTSTRMPFGSPHMIPGILMFLVYAISQGIGVVFSKAIEILMMLNPFQFFAKASEISLEARSSMQNTVTGSIPSKLVEYISDIYNALSKFGIGVAIPFFIVLFIAGALLFKKHDTWSKAKVLLLRVVFIAVGVPLMGVFYTEMLESVGFFAYDTVSSGVQMVASTFVDFKGWAQQYRLSPLEDNDLGVTLLESSSSGSGGSKAGHASDDSYTYLRRTVAIINKNTGTVTSVDWSSYGSVLDDVQKWSSNGLTQDGNATNQSFREGASLIQSYLIGDFYTAATWESDVMSSLSKNHRDKMGRLQGVDEDDAPDNTNTVLEMFSETNQADKWFGRTPTENQQIFKATDTYSANWQDFNIFSNGGLSVANNKADNTSSVIYRAGRFDLRHSKGMCPDSKVGLSTMSMYNYLSTTFDSSQMTVYSNKLAPSDYTKQQHYAVNLIGSGVAKILYYMSCFSVLFVVSIIGVYYCAKMIIQNIKRGINMLMSIPGAMMGSVRSIASFLVLTVMMVIELLATMICYMLVSQLLTVFVEVVEYPVRNLLSSVVVGGRLSFIGLSVDLLGTKLQLFVNLGVSAFVVLIFGYFVKKYAVRFLYVYNLAIEYIMLKYIVSDELRQSYLRRESDKNKSTLKGFLPEFLLE